MTYYNNTVKQMKIKFIISCILSLFMMIPPFIIGGDGMSIKMLLLYIPFGMILWPIEFLGMSLNIKPIFKGLIMPIPILSAIIECFKSVVIGFKAFIWMIRNWRNSK